MPRGTRGKTALHAPPPPPPPPTNETTNIALKMMHHPELGAGDGGRPRGTPPRHSWSAPADQIRTIDGREKSRGECELVSNCSHGARILVYDLCGRLDGCKMRHHLKLGWDPDDADEADDGAAGS